MFASRNTAAKLTLPRPTRAAQRPNALSATFAKRSKNSWAQAMCAFQPYLTRPGRPIGLVKTACASLRPTELRLRRAEAATSVPFLACTAHWPAPSAEVPRPNGFLPLVQPPARRCTAAWIAQNPSRHSSAFKRLHSFKTKNPKLNCSGFLGWFGVKPRLVSRQMCDKDSKRVEFIVRNCENNKISRTFTK